MAPEWYCPDLIEQILQEPIHHEFGTHSFSHIDFSGEPTGSALVAREMETCLDVMAPFHRQPRSLVYCFNHMGDHHLSLLYQLGITNVRHRDPNVRMAYPERTPSGVYRIYESMNLRIAAYYNYVQKARIFIEEAIRRNAAYHIWFHPSDGWRVFEEAFKPVLELVSAGRDKGILWVATMADLTAYCEARATTNIVVAERSGERLVLDLTTTLDESRFGSPLITLAFPTPCAAKTITIYHRDSVECLSDDDARVSRRPQELLLNVSCRAKRIEIVWDSRPNNERAPELGDTRQLDRCGNV